MNLFRFYNNNFAEKFNLKNQYFRFSKKHNWGWGRSVKNNNIKGFFRYSFNRKYKKLRRFNKKMNKNVLPIEIG